MIRTNRLDLSSDSVYQLICKAINTKQSDICDLKPMKTGMTNCSYFFRCNGKKYIVRLPGAGSNELINRNNEHANYTAINGMDICDNVIYFDKHTGLKITEFIPNARTCDPENKVEVKRCMRFLKKFHDMKLSVNHFFDLFDSINYYESLRKGSPSKFADYDDTKARVFYLKEYIDHHHKEYYLTHIDAIPDNFLLFERSGEERIRLIDWEYASMQDPDLDIAMFGIYSCYDETEINDLIDAYYEGKCTHEIRIKIYCYIAVSGLLWSNWCEFKELCGVSFGDYARKQYQYAREYSIKAKEMITEDGSFEQG